MSVQKLPFQLTKQKRIEFLQHLKLQPQNIKTDSYMYFILIEK